MAGEKRMTFVSNPTEIIKEGKPISNPDEINKALEKGELYKRGFLDAMNRFKLTRGEWVEGFDGYFETLNCNKCGYSKPSTHYEFNFCPNCGVPMTEKALEIIRKREGNENEKL